MRLALALVAACGAATAPVKRPTDGEIGGMTRDRDSGEAIGLTTVSLRRGSATVARTEATQEGLYRFEHVAPGRYAIDAETLGARAHVANIHVEAGAGTIADVELASGSAVSYDLAEADGIEHFTPAHHDTATGLAEGIVADAATHVPVPGAVVTLVDAGGQAQQAVTDDSGRYRFDGLLPGTYSISAYYAVEGHGQIELRRSGIAITAAHGVRVPLLIETDR